MGVKITGRDLDVLLKNELKRSGEGAREALKRGAEKIAHRAREYAPVDEHNLEKSIDVMDPEKDKSRGGRHIFVVGIHEDTPVASRPGVTVGDYSMIMHEGSYNLGEKSREKAETTGKKVGPKFLERAWFELEDEIEKDVMSNAHKRIGK